MSAASTADNPVLDAVRALHLRDWQVDAFGSWVSAGCQGAVEAVTGSGKTRLAMAAAHACLGLGGVVLVIVPTLELVRQWRREFRSHVPDARVGQLGGGRDDDFDRHDVVVATPHSASQVPIEPRVGQLGLLVADEAHRYGTENWSGALRDAFAMRLALTATWERNDDGIDEVLLPWFGSVVAEHTFADASVAGNIAPFRVAFARVGLSADDGARWRALDEQARGLFGQLRAEGLVSSDARRAVLEASRLAAESGPGTNGEAARLARTWLSAVGARRALAATNPQKIQVLRAVASGLGRSRTLVFTDTVEQAEQAASAVWRAGVKAAAVTGDSSTDDRGRILGAFAKGTLPVVAAPRILDEGIDVPAADRAVVLAAFRTRRQMIQRLGRVLRVKPDGAEARLLMLVSAGTGEDPAQGGHDEFRKLIEPVAQSVDRFEGVDHAPISQWLSGR